MKNSIVMSIFSDFDRKYTLFWKYVPKIKIVEAESVGCIAIHVITQGKVWDEKKTIV